MKRNEAKRKVTITLLISNIILLALMQPVFLGVGEYFGIDPRLIIMPVSFLTIIIIVLHLYQNWSLMLSWFKKSPDRKKQRDKVLRLVVLMAFMIVLGYDISKAWYEALTSESAEISIESMRIWSWVATGLLAVHVWQRWRLVFSYFKRKSSKKIG